MAMKTLTWTAFLAAIVAFPFLIRRRKQVPMGIRPVAGEGVSGEILRYDIDDLLT